jgi:nucleotide-binding universal stress UspA family protein
MMTAVQANKRIDLKNIVFLTDFSEPSDAALPYASAIARTYGSVVHALHVVLPSPYTYMALEAAGTVLGDEEDLAKAEMQRVEASLMGLPRQVMIERGAGVWPVLSEKLKEHKIDLIVLGTHGRTGVQKMLLGSAAEEVFRRARVPVLTIGPEVTKGVHSGGRFRCVLFATDFNAVSSAAAAYAVSLAQENGARLVLLHVLPKPRQGKASYSELSVAEGLHKLQELVPAEAELWCKPEPMVLHGNPAEETLLAAQQCGADLIVLGVRGLDELAKLRTRVARATAYQVVVQAPCPVLTVRG